MHWGMWENGRSIPVQQALSLNRSLIVTNKQEVRKPVWHNIKMWQELFRVCAEIGVELRERVRGSRT